MKPLTYLKRRSFSSHHAIEAASSNSTLFKNNVDRFCQNPEKFVPSLRMVGCSVDGRKRLIEKCNAGNIEKRRDIALLQALWALYDWWCGKLFTYASKHYINTIIKKTIFFHQIHGTYILYS